MKKTIAALTTAAFFSPVLTAQAKMPEEAALIIATEAVEATIGAGNIRAEKETQIIDGNTTLNMTSISATKKIKGGSQTNTLSVRDGGTVVNLKSTINMGGKTTSMEAPALAINNYMLMRAGVTGNGDNARQAMQAFEGLYNAFVRRIDDYNMANIEAAAHEAMKANLPAGALSWTMYDETKPTTLFARSCNPDLSCTQLATALKVDPETRVMSAAVTASETGPLLSPTMPRETHATTVTLADVRGNANATITTHSTTISNCADADKHEALADKAKETLNDFLLAKKGVVLLMDVQADKSSPQYGPVNFRPRTMPKANANGLNIQ